MSTLPSSLEKVVKDTERAVEAKRLQSALDRATFIDQFTQRFVCMHVQSTGIPDFACEHTTLVDKCYSLAVALWDKANAEREQLTQEVQDFNSRAS